MHKACTVSWKAYYTFSHVTIFNSILLNFLAEPENGETALHLAACANNEKIIKHLLSLGASPNVSDSLGRTPAMRAADYGHVIALELLAEADADLTGISRL